MDVKHDGAYHDIGSTTPTSTMKVGVKECILERQLRMEVLQNAIWIYFGSAVVPRDKRRYLEYSNRAENPGVIPVPLLSRADWGALDAHDRAANVK